MTMFKSVVARVSSWLSERRVAPRSKRRNSALVLCGLVAGLTLASASAAQAQVWNFVYTGSGFSASGMFTVGSNISCPGAPANTCANITSISGTHSLYGAIAGPWLASVASGPGFPGTTDGNYVGMYFTAGGVNTALLLFGSGSGTEYYGCGSVCDNAAAQSITGSITQAVPEIDASSGLGALAALFGVMLIFREMLLRRRGFATV